MFEKKTGKEVVVEIGLGGIGLKEGENFKEEGKRAQGFRIRGGSCQKIGEETSVKEKEHKEPVCLEKETLGLSNQKPLGFLKSYKMEFFFKPECAIFFYIVVFTF